MTPEQRLWASVMMMKIHDAAYPFDIGHDAPPLEEQFEKIKSKPPVLSNEKRVNIRAGMYYLESSQFDEMASYIDYGSVFVNKTFRLVQKIITMRRKIYDELLMLPEQRKMHDERMEKRARELAKTGKRMR